MAGERVDKGIRRLAPGRYEFRGFSHGEPISETRHAKSDNEAKKMWRAWRVQVDDGRIRRGGESVTALMHEYLVHKAPNLSPTTLQLYRGLVKNHIAPSKLGGMAVSKVRTRDLDAFYGELQESGAGAVTARKCHIVLHGAFAQAVRWGRLAMNPATHTTRPKLPERKTEDLTLSASEVASLISAARGDDDVLAVLIHLAGATGARRGELVGLKWSDLDLDVDDGSMSVRRSVIRDQRGAHEVLMEKAPKSGKRRWVSLDPDTVQVMLEYRERCAARALEAGATMADNAWVFSLRPGNTEWMRPEVVTRRFHRLAKSLGIDKTFHGLRHFHCTQLILGGEDVVTVSSRVGHAKPSITTDTYSHAMPGRDREAATRIGNIMRAAHEKTTV